MPTLEPLSPHLVTQLRTVRLRALKEDPTAFGSTYAKESQLTDEDWLQRVATWHSDRSACYLAMDTDIPCGIIASYFDRSVPKRAHVVSMWVAPTHRRTGLATTLINTIERWAQNLEARELSLLVTNKNAPAIHFYERCGFTFTGETEPYANDPTLLVYEMVKSLLDEKEVISTSE